MSHQNQPVSRKTLLSILATALIAFAGILSETSMNVTFPHLMKVFHTDAVQALSEIKIDVKDLNVDLISVPDFMYNAPIPLGAWTLWPETESKNFLFGGSQERSRRAGTENVAANLVFQSKDFLIKSLNK